MIKEKYTSFYFLEFTIPAKVHGPNRILFQRTKLKIKL